jgi:hypothetical protein
MSFIESHTRRQLGQTVPPSLESGSQRLSSQPSYSTSSLLGEPSGTLATRTTESAPVGVGREGLYVVVYLLASALAWTVYLLLG